MRGKRTGGGFDMATRRRVSPPLRRLVLLLALGYHCAAGAALTCEQLANIAYATQQLRNQGQSLQAVLAEADKLESSGKFTAGELERIRDVVDTAFTGGRSPLEVLQECKDRLPR